MKFLNIFLVIAVLGNLNLMLYLISKYIVA